MSKKAHLVCLVLLIGLVLPLLSWAQQRTNPVVSPEILPDNSVIFRINAPKAQSVRLLGTWLKDLRNTIEMTRKDSSVFEVKVGPLPADMYEYRFIVDGIALLDPANSYRHPRRINQRKPVDSAGPPNPIVRRAARAPRYAIGSLVPLAHDRHGPTHGDIHPTRLREKR